MVLREQSLGGWGECEVSIADIDAGTTVVITVLVLLVLLVVLIPLRGKKKALGGAADAAEVGDSPFVRDLNAKVKIVASKLQITGMLSIAYNVKLPGVFEAFAGLLNVVSLDVFQMLPADCVYPTDKVEKAVGEGC